MASIWVAAGQAYTFKVKSFGGVNCASGSTIRTIDGIGGGSTLATVVVPYSATPTFTITAQTILFRITLTGNASAQPLTAVGIIPPAFVTFEITQDGAGGHTFAWPANSVGGATIGSTANQVTVQSFIWNGTQAEAIGPGVTGNGPSLSTGPISAVGNINLTGNLIAGGGISGTTGTFTGIVQAPTFRSSSANPASAGTIRLAQADTIFWRNVTNTTDEGLSTDGVDRLNISHAAGVMLTGASPNILMGGSSNVFPMLKRSLNGINVRLADDSGDAAISASTLGWNGPTGPTLNGSCSAGQVLVASSPTSVSCGVSPATIQSASRTINTGTVIGAANTTWITKAVTMPSAGCPCRAFVSYGAFYASGASGTAVFWVDDGTSNFATSQILTATAGGNAASGNGSGFSPTTYSNGAVITFNGRGNANTAGSITIGGPAFGSTENSYLNVVIFTSN